MTKKTEPEPPQISRRNLLSVGAATLALSPVSKAVAQAGKTELLVNLTFEHDYLRQVPPAIKAVLAYPVEIRRDVFYQQTPGQMQIGRSLGGPRPQALYLQLSTDDPDFLAYTSVNDAPLGADKLYVTNQTPSQTIDIRRMDPAEAQDSGLGPQFFAMLEIALPDEGALDLKVRFEVTKTLWSYYVTSQANPLRDGDIEYWIEDVDRIHSFAHTETVLDGTGTRIDVFRSAKTIPLSAHPTQHFQLRKVERTTGSPSEFSIVLNRLPAATTRLDLPQPKEPDGALMSRMYLSL